MDVKLLDLKAVLKDFTYKPNFAFSIYEHNGRDMIKITMIVENSREPSHPWVIQPVPRREVFFDSYEIEYRTLARLRDDSIVGYSPPRPVTEVWGNYTIPYFDEGMAMQFVEWLRICIRKMEDHEIDEWIRYNGELVHDPHAKD